MKSLASLTVIAAALCGSGCAITVQSDDVLTELIARDLAHYPAVLADPAEYRLQIIYTRIDRRPDRPPTFESYRYRVDADEYHYPASTVKLPVALLALEKVHALAVPGLDSSTAMLTDTATPLQTSAHADPSAPDGLPSIAHYVRKLFVVSDNDAFNRLFEFVGPAGINDALADKGLGGVRIVHRLSVARNDEENRITNPIRFVADERIVHAQPSMRTARDFHAERPIPIGSGERVDGALIERPKDFRGNNEFPLQACHDVVKAAIFPEAVAETERFDLAPDDRKRVLDAMSVTPRASGIDKYADAADYPDGYVKFLLYGGKAAKIPPNIQIYNKVGNAYGFLTDCAYVVDADADVEFLLAATIYVNANGIFNDDNYEYDEIGLPFLRDLGLSIYRHELSRSRAYRPDLVGPGAEQ